MFRTINRTEKNKRSASARANRMKRSLPRSAPAVLIASGALLVAATSGAVAGGLITTAQIKDNAVTSSKIKNSNVKTADIRNNAVKSSKVKDFSLSNQDVGVLFAQVNADGTLANSSGAVSVEALQFARYAVDFNRNVTNCAFTATIADPDDGLEGPGQIDVADLQGNADAVFVRTSNSSGTSFPSSFNLIVVC